MTQAACDLLCVEDNLGDLRLLHEALEILDLPHHLHHAPDGEAALTFLRRAQRGEVPWPDAVLLDLNLPRKTGQEVLAELGADPRLRELRVIVLTTAARERDVIASMQSRPVHFMIKPLDFDDFIGVVEKIHGLIVTRP
jgi:CheY-like chemotaxis protein